MERLFVLSVFVALAAATQDIETHFNDRPGQSAERIVATDNGRNSPDQALVKGFSMGYLYKSIDENERNGSSQPPKSLDQQSPETHTSTPNHLPHSHHYDQKPPPVTHTSTPNHYQPNDFPFPTPTIQEPSNPPVWNTYDETQFNGNQQFMQPYSNSPYYDFPVGAQQPTAYGFAH